MSFSKRQGNDAVCYTKPLDSLKEMDLLAFIWTVDPMKVRIGKRQRTKDEPKLLDTTVGRVVPLLPVVSACASSELDVSVDKLFDKGRSSDQAEQRDSANVRGGVVPTLPFMTSSVFAIPEHEGEDHTGFVAGTTLRTVMYT
ncbi:hypothetical protein Tco_0606959 [Tanacetum coccineum]